MIKGIKSLGMDMEAIRGNKMIYELNKEYVYDGDVKCRRSGYHYFNSIRDVMTLYNLNESRLFECELNGDVFDHDGIVHCTNKIKLIREITKEEIKKYIEDNSDILVNDIDWVIRLEVAKQGYGLDKLINDEHWFVREEVARQGYCLDILINDKDWHVRKEVARQGYKLIKLSFDKNKIIKNEARTKLYIIIKEKLIVYSDKLK